MKTYLEYIKENSQLNIKSENDWDKATDQTKIIVCDDLSLTMLPELPINLKELYCINNKVTKLPKLPSGLKILICSKNHLTGLPDLPDNLYYLSCDQNKIQYLPELPSGLQELYCNDNPLECLIPEEFYEMQNDDWIESYLKEIKTYQFQKKLLQKDKNQIHELIRRNILHSKIKKEYSPLISSLKWGMI